MTELKKLFFEKSQMAKNDMAELKKSADTVIGEVKLGQVLTGMKGIPALITETSKLDPNEGIRYRGYSLDELMEKLPRVEAGKEPLPESVLFLFLTGEIPTVGQTLALQEDLVSRLLFIPDFIYRVIDAMPENATSMSQFSTAISILTNTSQFKGAYKKGTHKADLWDPMYEDMLNLLAWLPKIAAYIYRKRCGISHIAPDPDLDWGANMAHMMGLDSQEVHNLFRFFLILHADHEGGNVSAHAAHLVGSAMSDIFYAYSAAMKGLAGPLHGRANQDVLKWIDAMVAELGTNTPTDEAVAKYIQDTLDNGKVVPGYGHAVLRKTDPRFTIQLAFAKKNIKDADPAIALVEQLYRVVPEILKTKAKIQNPWPNVDAISGTLLRHYNIRWADFYTVMFGVGRALGVLPSLTIDRAIGLPLERPTSFPLSWYKEKVKKQ